MKQYSRACGSYNDFIDRGLLLTRNQGLVTLGSIYGTSTSQMTRYFPLVKASRSFPHSLLIGFVTRLTQRVPLVGQEMLTFQSTRVQCSSCYFIFIVLCVCFVDCCFCPFVLRVLQNTDFDYLPPLSSNSSYSTNEQFRP